MSDTIADPIRSSSVYIRALILTFPCLREFAPPANKDFDPDEFRKRLNRASTGERLCGSFILAVWNPGNFDDDFDFMDFISSVDGENRKAFLNWAQQPYFP